MKRNFQNPKHFTQRFIYFKFLFFIKIIKSEIIRKMFFSFLKSKVKIKITKFKLLNTKWNFHFFLSEKKIGLEISKNAEKGISQKLHHIYEDEGQGQLKKNWQMSIFNCVSGLRKKYCCIIARSTVLCVINFINVFFFQVSN